HVLRTLLLLLLLLLLLALLRRFPFGDFAQLLLLPLPEQGADLVRFQQTGQSDVLLFVLAGAERRGAERGTVVDDLVQFGFSAESGESPLLLARFVPLAIGLGQQLIVPAALLPVRLAQHVVPLGFQLARQFQQHGHAGQEDARRL